MSVIALNSIIVVAGLILFGIIIFLSEKSKKYKGPDYYAFFIAGIIYAVAGLFLFTNLLVIAGLSFALIGIIFKKRWKRNHIKWSKLSKKEKVRIITLILIFGIIAVVGFMCC